MHITGFVADGAAAEAFRAALQGRRATTEAARLEYSQDELTGTIAGMIEQGLAAMKRALEARAR